MPFVIRVEPEQRIVRVEISGAPDLDEQKGTYRRIQDTAGYERGMPILIDDRGRSTAAATSEIRSLADATSDLRVDLKGTRCAVLVGSDVQYGMSRMWAARAEASGMQIEVFRDETEAIRWLRAEGEDG